MTEICDHNKKKTKKKVNEHRCWKIKWIGQMRPLSLHTKCNQHNEMESERPTLSFCWSCFRGCQLIFHLINHIKFNPFYKRCSLTAFKQCACVSIFFFGFRSHFLKRRSSFFFFLAADVQNLNTIGRYAHTLYIFSRQKIGRVNRTQLQQFCHC